MDSSGREINKSAFAIRSSADVSRDRRQTLADSRPLPTHTRGVNRGARVSRDVRDLTSRESRHENCARTAKAQKEAANKRVARNTVSRVLPDSDLLNFPRSRAVYLRMADAGVPNRQKIAEHAGANKSDFYRKYSRATLFASRPRFIERERESGSRGKERQGERARVFT